MHAVNNGLIGTLAQRPQIAAWFGMDMASGDLPWMPVLLGTAVMAGALALLWATTGPRPDLPAERSPAEPASRHSSQPT